MKSGDSAKVNKEINLNPVKVEEDKTDIKQAKQKSKTYSVD